MGRGQGQRPLSPSSRIEGSPNTPGQLKEPARQTVWSGSPRAWGPDRGALPGGWQPGTLLVGAGWGSQSCLARLARAFLFVEGKGAAGQLFSLSASAPDSCWKAGLGCACEGGPGVSDARGAGLELNPHRVSDLD